jgi:hypothetical protein
MRYEFWTSSALAADFGIELRAFESLTPDDIVSWLPIYSPLLICDAPQVVGVRFFLKPTLDSPVPPDSPLPVKLDDAAFTDTETGEQVTVNHIWQRVSNNVPLFEGIIPDAEPVKRTVIPPEAVTTPVHR